VKRLRIRQVALAAAFVFIAILPAIALLRTPKEGRPPIDSLSGYLGWVQDSVMVRTTSLEGFAVTYQNLDLVPPPDPLSLVVTGPIPRVLWPDKPFANWIVTFSEWASGDPTATLTPSLPGELLVYFGYVGGLAAWLGLGILWRWAFCALVGGNRKPNAGGFIYIAMLPLSLQAMEGGLVVGYSGLLRYLWVGLLFLFVATSRAKPARSGERASRPLVSATLTG
jgi:hypothetical protein